MSNYQSPTPSGSFYGATQSTQPASQPPTQQPTPESSQSAVGASSSSSAAGAAAPAAGQTSRAAAEEARKDRTLAEFLVMLDDYEPLIPNEVTDYYLQRVGFDCQDVRLKRLLSLAAQKFVSDIAADAYSHARIRTSAAAGRSRAGGLGGIRDKARTTLTMEDLSAALGEYGINARKPDFFI